MQLHRKYIIASLSILTAATLAPLLAPSAYCREEKGRYAEGGSHRPAILPIKNQMPLYIFYLNMLPDTAACLNQGKFKLDLDYQVSNGVLDKVTTGTELYIVQIDAEVYRVSGWLKYGITDNLEASIEIPYLGLTKGYLDGFVEDFEDFFGFVTPGARENSARYSYKYEVRYQGQYLIQKNTPSEGMGDISAYLKYKVADEKPSVWYAPAISLRGAVKFPTGDENDLVGSGETDFGLGLLLDKHLTDRLAFYGNTNLILIERPKYFSVWDMDDYIFYWMAALEYDFTHKFSTILQHMGNTTPYPESGTHPLDNTASDIGLGLNYRFTDNLLGTFSCVENTITDSSPDISFHSGLKYKF